MLLQLYGHRQIFDTTTENFDKEVKDIFGHTPFHISCKQGNMQIIAYLIGKGVQKEAKDGETCIHLACLQEKIDVIRYLIETHKMKIN